MKRAAVRKISDNSVHPDSGIFRKGTGPIDMSEKFQVELSSSTQAMDMFWTVKSQFEQLDRKTQEIFISLSRIVYGVRRVEKPSVLRAGRALKAELENEARITGSCQTAPIQILETAKSLRNEEQYNANSRVLEMGIRGVDEDICETARSALKMVFNIPDTRDGCNNLSGMKIINILPLSFDADQFGTVISEIANRWQKARDNGKSYTQFYDEENSRRGCSS